MGNEPVAPKASRTPWIIAGVLGCLVLCLLIAVVFVAGYFMLGNNPPVAAGTPTTRIAVQSPVPTIAPPTVIVPTVPPLQPTGIPTTLTQPTLAPTNPPAQPTATIPQATATRVPPTATRPPAAPTGRILFSKNEGDQPENKSIWIMNADGTNAKKILDKASHPSFSPDGTKLVYYHWTDGLWVANADGTNQKKIVGDTFTGGDYGSPDWSHDGRFIAFSTQPSGRGNIFVDAVNPDGTGRHTLVVGEAPSWSPDDTSLVFHTCRDIGCGIFKASSAGGQDAVPVVTDDGGLPAFSPNGKLILYQKEADGAKQLFVVNPDGSGKKQLTRGPAMHVSANWSVDGNFIFYRSPEGGPWGIWVMNADGTNPHKLMDNVAPVNWPYERIAVTK